VGVICAVKLVQGMFLVKYSFGWKKNGGIIKDTSAKHESIKTSPTVLNIPVK